MNKTNIKRYSRLILLVFALCLVLACVVACDKNSKIDYVSQLPLDMSSTTAKTEVTVKNYIDGDTTHFWAPRDVSPNGVVKARYIAINTPESTGRIEEFGKAASRFTKDKLKSATSIVLESENETWNKDSNGRYLVWVWYKPQGSDQYRNLNLEILQEGLAVASNTAQSRYGEICINALNQAEACKLHVFSGKQDPDMYYGGVQEVSLKELRCNLDAYAGITVAFEGNIVNDYGGSIYLEEYDQESGLYFGITAYYGTSGLTSSGREIISKGNRVRLVGSVQYFEAGDVWQISGLKHYIREPDNPENQKKLGDGKVAAYPLVEASKFVGKVTITTQKGGEMEYDFAYAAMNTSISMNNLKVVKIYTTKADDSASKGAMTLTCRAADGNQIVVRTTVLYDKDENIVTEDAYKGKTINIKGFVESYEGEYQIKVFSPENITIAS